LLKEKVKIMKKCLCGRTRTNKIVVFEGAESLINQTIEVEIVKDRLWYLEGKM
jgi:hypothetical protein